MQKQPFNRSVSDFGPPSTASWCTLTKRNVITSLPTRESWRNLSLHNVVPKCNQNYRLDASSKLLFFFIRIKWIELRTYSQLVIHLAHETKTLSLYPKIALPCNLFKGWEGQKPFSCHIQTSTKKRMHITTTTGMNTIEVARWLFLINWFD